MMKITKNLAYLKSTHTTTISEAVDCTVCIKCGFDKKIVSGGLVVGSTKCRNREAEKQSVHKKKNTSYEYDED